jgi:hypothetical protein
MDDQFRIEMIETYPLFWGTLILCNLWKPQNAGVLNNEMRMFLMLVMVLQSTKVVVEAKKLELSWNNEAVSTIDIRIYALKTW